MILKAHRMAELMNQLHNMSGTLVDNETGIEYKPVRSLNRRLVFFHRSLEPAQVANPTLVAVSRIQHAERINFAIVVPIVQGTIERRIFFQHR